MPGLPVRAATASGLLIKRDRDRLRELVGWLEEEYGAVSESERAATLGELEDLDAEHARRDPDDGRAGEAE
ncbi:hypothetical protein AB0I77_27040 [Streptomyces sp. NPDC050619]|uniref:hypothetical protein n=1 Tax=Streptomyces sp. NPDC050619 TaxID=3157214 RepID=UPI0034348755